MTAPKPAKPADPKGELKRKANAMRKTLAQIDKLTGNSFTVARRADVAKFCGVSVQAVDKWLAAGMPGNRNAYDLQKIIHWLRSDGPWRPGPAGRGTMEAGAPGVELEGVESEWSEEYRKWKARIAQVEYEERIGQLMRVDEGQRIWAETVMPLVRGFAERVIKAHGNGTAQDWDDTCQQIDGAIERAFSDIGTDGHAEDSPPGVEGLDGLPAPEPSSVPA